MVKRRDSSDMARLPDGHQQNWPLVRALMAEMTRAADQWVLIKKELELRVDSDLCGWYETWEDAQIDMGEHLRDVAETEITLLGKRASEEWYLSVRLSAGGGTGWDSTAYASGPIQAECQRYARGLQDFVMDFLDLPARDAQQVPLVEYLHAEVRNASLSQLLSGHADDAVEQACKSVGARLRRMSGLQDDGKRLVTAALGGPSPRLAVGDLATPSGLSEQEGYLHLGVALFQAARNPRAHRVASTPIDLAESAEWMAVASLMHRALDGVGSDSSL